ncbi:adhesion G protein-coupled receptor E2-like isoform X3 [Branchiostoma lanceolatum]|uniref:adhesion G protein-coupled receptor E2-like isoform X2 n=1 Tax=Branchiostoma lanceolatum TaxID=7740 RepID=UPI00345434F6
MTGPQANYFIVTAALLILLAGESAAWRRRRRTCSAVNCQWGPWTSWSSCTTQCGSLGTRTRTRPYSPAASCGGAPCSGSNFETEECNRFCPNGTPSGAGCDCSGTGFTGTCCDIAADVDECALGTDTCHDQATCANTPGSYTCDCNSGYTGNGNSCTDEDECALGTDTCDENAICNNTPGDYTCTCGDGFNGDGYTCTDDDECALGTDTCDDDATCVNAAGSYTCDCNPGYRGDGNTCDDINECDEGTDTCDDDATCTNTPGSYTCECSNGFNGDGNTCTDIDECAEGTDTCHEQATCTNTPGGYSCACDHPYTGDGYSCSASCSDLYPGLRPARNFGKFRNQCFWSPSHRTRKLNYTKARQECGSHGGAGALAMIKDVETQNFLRNHLKRTSGKTQKSFWIGLDDLNDEHDFKWNDGTLLGGYDKFRSNAPHKIRDCVVLWRTRKVARWEIKNCGSTFPYICQLDGGS